MDLTYYDKPFVNYLTNWEMQSISMGSQKTEFESIFNEYRHYVIGLIHKFGGIYNTYLSPEDIQELEQICWLKIFEVASGTVIINFPTSYIFKLVRNSFIDYSREISKHKSAIVSLEENIIGDINVNLGSPDFKNILNSINNDKYISEIKLLLKKLPLKKQLIFKMRYIDNCTQEETARFLKIGQSTVSEHEAFILRYLKDELTKKLGSYN